MKGTLEAAGTIFQGVELRTMGETDTAAFMRNAESETPEDVLILVNARLFVQEKGLIEVRGYRALGDKQFPEDGPSLGEQYDFIEVRFTVEAIN